MNNTNDVLVSGPWFQDFTLWVAKGVIFWRFELAQENVSLCNMPPTIRTVTKLATWNTVPRTAGLLYWLKGEIVMSQIVFPSLSVRIMWHFSLYVVLPDEGLQTWFISNWPHQNNLHPLTEIRCFTKCLFKVKIVLCSVKWHALKTF
jgi:hypothetical protein